MLDNKTSIVNCLNPRSSLRNQDEHHGAKPDFKIAITNGGLDPKKLKKQKQNRASKATFSGLQAGRLDVRGRLDLGGHGMQGGDSIEKNKLLEFRLEKRIEILF